MERYHLETLFDLRRQAEARTRAALSVAARALAEASAAVKQLEDELAQRRRERAHRAQAGSSAWFAQGVEVSQASAEARFQERLRSEELELTSRITVARQALEHRLAELERCRGEWAQASRERAALERHRARFENRQRAARQVREEQANDEVAEALRRRRET